MKLYAIVVRNRRELEEMNKYYGVRERAYPRLYVRLGMVENTKEIILCEHNLEEAEFFKTIGYKIFNVSMLK